MASHNFIRIKSSNLFFIIIIITSCGSTPDNNIIYGKWEGQSQEKIFLFEFKQDQTCDLLIKDNGLNLIEKINGNFEIDYSKNPIPLSINNITQLSHPLYTIIDFINNDSIKVAYFAPKWKIRPLSFSHEKTIIIKRKKE